MIVPLHWDSQHFEISIVRTTSSELNDAELGDVLSCARANGADLVYCAIRPDRDLPPELLENFSGKLLDKKATFQRDFFSEPSSDWVEKTSHMFTVVEYEQSQATEQLLSLAVQSGIHSRFNRDPYIPKGKFESMYHIWMKRSTVHELADVVLVAVDPSNVHEYFGVITVSVRYGVGRIGLIGVLQDHLGRGVGTGLMHAMHQWMLSYDIKETVVVTQHDNIAACKLYARLGYRLASLQNIYHFWPQK